MKLVHVDAKKVKNAHVKVNANVKNIVHVDAKNINVNVKTIANVDVKKIKNVNVVNNMKEIIINDDNLKIDDIEKIKKKARAILIKDNKILVGVYSDVVMLPGGGAEKGEDINDTLIRELEEETGIKYNIEDFKQSFNITCYQKDYPTRSGKNVNRLVSTYYYIGEFKGIDPEKLKTSLEVNKNEDIIDIILPAIDSVEDVIKTKLNMTDKEYETLKSSVSEETLKKLNILSYNVVENYKVLDNIGINNIRECLTKYPSKLMLDTSEFKVILDKYDQDDLVRCINKNPKVLDKI
jgi:8-oxo-dGTP pyrophosphatase MutT (NUDIX family)